jgi:hypothetical protein
LGAAEVIKTYNSTFYYPPVQRLVNWAHYFEINFFKDMPQQLNVLYKFMLANLWLKDNTNKEAIIISRKPSITSLFSERKAICYPFSLNPNTLIEVMRQNRADYVLIDETDESLRYLIPAVKKNRDFFEPLVYLEEIIILRCKK